MLLPSSTVLSTGHASEIAPAETHSETNRYICKMPFSKAEISISSSFKIFRYGKTTCSALAITRFPTKSKSVSLLAFCFPPFRDASRKPQPHTFVPAMIVPLSGWAAHEVIPSDRGMNLFCVHPLKPFVSSLGATENQLGRRQEHILVINKSTH